jgi:hypothetical protein
MALAPSLLLLAVPSSFDHGLVERDLALCIHAANVVAQRAVDGGHGLGHALAQKASHHRAVRPPHARRSMHPKAPSRGRWIRLPAHVDFNGRVAAAVEDFP